MNCCSPIHQSVFELVCHFQRLRGFLNICVWLLILFFCHQQGLCRKEIVLLLLEALCSIRHIHLCLVLLKGLLCRIHLHMQTIYFQNLWLHLLVVYRYKKNDFLWFYLWRNSVHLILVFVLICL